jgi:hypothetical protein
MKVTIRICADNDVDHRCVMRQIDIDLARIRPHEASRIVGDQARLESERAMFGRLLPTPVREGGRGGA